MSDPLAKGASRTRDLDSILDEVTATCGIGEFDDALNLLRVGLTRSPDSAADLVFICACTLALAGDFENAKTFALKSFKLGRHTEASIRVGGKIFLGAGSRGEKCRLLFSRNRLWPLAHTGSLNAAIATKADLAKVEPWYFSKTMGSAFPKQGEFEKKLDSSFIKKHVLKGYLPEQPLFTKDAKILTVGSCFAEELRNYFLARDFSSNVVFIPPGLNNTFALDSYFRWMLTGDDFDRDYWFDDSKTGGMKWNPTENRDHLVSLMRDLDCVVVTVGLAEVWSDSITGKVFWRGVPRNEFDPERHICRVSNVEENRANLASVFRNLRALSPRAEIIFSLSPVPLKATQTGRSCMTADSLSKATLRIALDEFLKFEHSGARYWPSFEIVRWLGSHINTSLFGEDGNSRHVNRAAVELILDAFIDAFFAKSSAEPGQSDALVAS